MTQKNIDVMDIIVSKLKTGTNFSKALELVYDKRTVCIPYDESMFEIKVEAIKKSAGLTNLLLRNKIKTLNEAIDFCTEYGVLQLKGCGKKYGTELFENILDYRWDHMTEKERVEFLIDTVERNSNNIRAEIA